MFVNLTQVQRRRLAKAIEKREPYTLKLTKKQVSTISDEPEDGKVELKLNKLQAKQCLKARASGTPFVVSYSKSQIMRGGFIPLIPLLLSALPGLLGAAPQILDGVKSGYENVGKLVGIKAGSSLNLQGDALDLHGQSLKIFGEHAKKKAPVKVSANTVIL